MRAWSWRAFLSEATDLHFSMRRFVREETSHVDGMQKGQLLNA